MKFVDEAFIQVEAGRGGDGCLSFLREKFVPRGGPNGGDGGDGGSIYALADPQLNTLVDFRYQRIFRAQNGMQGQGKNCSGRSGEDLVIRFPVGTLIKDADTEELIADLTHPNQREKLAQGGFHGIGNARFKSSINQAPRQTTKGTEGEQRRLHLELKLLADVGLLGLPNAGKSTLIRAVSAARPKVADYPFTTLHPNLGVVSVGTHRSFVMADVPGLIPGAASGVGLGVRFLKHLARTRLLLHLVDLYPVDESDPAEQINSIFHELELFDKALAARTRWLVFNKIDLMPQEESVKRCKQIVSELKWQGPVFMISALAKTGLDDLCQKIMNYLESM